VFTLRLNSLYSIRIPFTWQSALTYPVLPPSAVIGLIANALQRCKNDKHPREYLKKVEEEIIWAGSRLLTPCLIKSYTTSAITKWEDTVGGKFTNALSRQFSFSKNLQVIAIFKNNNLSLEGEALLLSPLTCGDSESPVTIEDPPEIKDTEEIVSKEVVETYFPVPFVKNIEIIDSGGQVYLMHERCLKRDERYLLRSYVVPLIEVKGILRPTILKVKGVGIKIYKIGDIPIYVIGLTEESEKSVSKRKISRNKKRWFNPSF